MRIGKLTSRLPSGGRFGTSLSIILREGSIGNDGRWTVDPEVEVPVTGHAQPATGDDIEKLDEGDRIKEAQKVFITSYDRDSLRPLRVGADATKADIVIIKGIRYLVRHIDDYSTHGHIEAIVVREEGQDG